MPGDRRSLLIVACSQRKRPDPGLLPALVRYDGTVFRILRKLQRQQRWPPHLDVLVLSAKYGLIWADTPIEYYDQRMSEERAEQLREAVGGTLREVAANGYGEVFINAGKLYRLALADWLATASSTVTVIVAEGGIGQKAAQMRRWLLARVR